MSSRRLFVARVRRLRGLLAVVAMGLVGRAVWLQGVQHRHLRRLADEQHLNQVRVPAHRGDIVDRNHSAMAISVNVPSLFANPREVPDAAMAAAQLAPLLQLPAAQLQQRLAAERFFVWLRRHLTAEQAQRVVALGLPGVQLAYEPRRYYPNHDAASFVVGFAGIDARGLEGVEHAFDRQLLGAPHTVAAVRDARGRALLDGGGAAWERKAGGHTLALSLDLPLQHAAEAALSQAVRQHRAKAAYAVVLDVAHAQVLSLAVSPGFNANQAGQTAVERRRNRAITDLFEPGSVLKPVVVAAALQAGSIRPADLFAGEGGRLRIGRHTISDTSVHARMSVTEVLAKSSNIGMARIGQSLGADRLHAALAEFGLGQRSGVELPGEAPGSLRPANTWSELELATISFGQGVAVNLLQLAAAYRVLAADGLYQAPRLGHRLWQPDGIEVGLPPPPQRRVLEGATARQLTAMLEAAVAPDTGTGRLAQVAGYRVAGKTGTAQKADLHAGGYSKDRYVALFCGYLPADRPQVVVVVAVDEPKHSHYGGVVAAPVFAQVASVAMQRLGVAPAEVAGAWAGSLPAPAVAPPAQPGDLGPLEAADDAFVVPRADAAGQRAVPSFVGLSARQALRRGGSLQPGWQLQLRGSGRVVRQLPPAGPPPNLREQVVALELEGEG